MKKQFFLFILIVLVILLVIIPKTNCISIKQVDDTGTIKITIDFLIPINETDVEEKIHLTSERPETYIRKSIRWVNSRTLEILAIEEGLPRGFKTTLRIGPLKTNIPGISKYAKTHYRANISPFLTDVSTVVSSKGPITLNYSTPIKSGALKGIQADFNFTVLPSITVKPDGKIFKDYSSWNIIPNNKLENEKTYKIEFKGSIDNRVGSKRNADFIKMIKVAKRSGVISTEPSNGAIDVKLYTPLIVNFETDIKEANIILTQMRGDIELNGKVVEYKPHSVFMPGKTYRVKVIARSYLNEELETYEFEFSTVDMKDDIWVEINQRPIQKVVVYKGNKLIKAMRASTGLSQPEFKTPNGYFTTKDRGMSFYSQQHQEGGLYWVRVVGNHLIHSVPRDSDGHIIEEERKRLGYPASHGCIRLKDEDAKWFYEYVPQGALVIIHE